jgi:hypothetical protein
MKNIKEDIIFPFEYRNLDDTRTIDDHHDSVNLLEGKPMEIFDHKESLEEVSADSFHWPYSITK